MKDLAKTIVLAGGLSVGAAFVGVAAWVGMEKSREIAIDNCERQPEYCPNREIRFATPQASEKAGSGKDEIGLLIKSLTPVAP